MGNINNYYIWNYKVTTFKNYYKSNLDWLYV